MPNLRRVGGEGEDQAAEYLIGKGYTIVTRNFTSSRGEIDLVAFDGDQLVVVEVKYRRTRGEPAEAAFDHRKVERLMNAAEDYLQAVEEPDRSVRYDLVAIDLDGLRHHVGAV